MKNMGLDSLVPHRNDIETFETVDDLVGYFKVNPENLRNQFGKLIIREVELIVFTSETITGFTVSAGKVGEMPSSMQRPENIYKLRQAIVDAIGFIETNA